MLSTQDLHNWAQLSHNPPVTIIYPSELTYTIFMKLFTILATLAGLP